MDISIITVTYNSAEHILDQIRSVVSACGGLLYEQIIVDNGSTDETVRTIREAFPNICLIENQKNKGFATANNQAVSLAKGDLLFFLNPDMVVLGGGSMREFVSWMQEKKNVGIAGCQLLDAHGLFNRRATPRRFPRWYELFVLIFKLPHVFPRILDRYLMADFDPTREQDVESVRGSCMLVRRELVRELGFAFDPRYFIWFEDVDLCREARKRGWRVVYTPIVSCVDRVGASFRKRSWLWKQTHFIASAVRYLLK